MKIKIILLFITVLSLVNTSNAMEEIATKDGNSFVGYNIEDKGESILITNEDGVEIEISKAMIIDRKIVFSDIYTKTGGKYVANLIKANNKFFTFIAENGNVLKIEKQDFDSLIVRTINPNISNWHGWKNEYKPLGVKEKYRCLGVELGTPGIVNLSITYYDTYLTGFKITAGIFPPNAWGCEANILFSIIKSLRFDSNLFLATGLFNNKQFRTNDETYWYLGGGADMNYKSFYLKLGVGVGFNSKESTQTILPLISAGYVYRFNE